MLATIEARLAQARAGEPGHTGFLQVLCEDEISRRESMSMTRRLRRARFEEQVTLEGFDFTAQPGDLSPRGWRQCWKRVTRSAAHGCYHENLGDLEAGEERRLMEIQLAQHAEVTGRRPRGYRSPSWDFTDETAGLLEEFGFDWDSSLMGREFEPYYPRPVTTNDRSASEFGPASPVLEFPVTWYLDDFPAVEYVPGVAEQLGSHREMFARWQDIFDYAYECVSPALYILTVHPQCIGRAHLVAAFEDFLTGLRQQPGLWRASLSEVFEARSAE